MLGPDAGLPQDSKFEVLRWAHNLKLRLVQQLLKVATGKTDLAPSVAEFSFTTVAVMPMQLDSELVKLKAQQKVIVVNAPSKLRTYC